LVSQGCCYESPPPPPLSQTPTPTPTSEGEVLYRGALRSEQNDDVTPGANQCIFGLDVNCYIVAQDPSWPIPENGDAVYNSNLTPFNGGNKTYRLGYNPTGGGTITAIVDTNGAITNVYECF
jgi:hypothetical protein